MTVYASPGATEAGSSSVPSSPAALTSMGRGKALRQVVADLIKRGVRPTLAVFGPPCPFSSSLTHDGSEHGKGDPKEPIALRDDALAMVKLLTQLFKPSLRHLLPYYILYECAGDDCFATEQSDGGQTPFVQMTNLFDKRGYTYEKIENLRAVTLGNTTNRSRNFLVATLDAVRLDAAPDAAPTPPKRRKKPKRREK